MATEIIGTDEFRDWYRSLPQSAQERVEYVVDMLAELGTELGHPYSSDYQRFVHRSPRAADAA